MTTPTTNQAQQSTPVEATGFVQRIHALSGPDLAALPGNHGDPEYIRGLTNGLLLALSFAEGTKYTPIDRPIGLAAMGRPVVAQQSVHAGSAAPTDELRTAVARAIWNIRREEEDRCDIELEDAGTFHTVWEEADAAIAAIVAQPVEAAGSAAKAEPMSEHNARFAIDGAIQYGRENRNEPPSTGHWLYEYWNIGRQLATLGATGWDNITPMSESAAAPADLSQAATDVLAERRRQVEQEGWTPEHDDEHADGSLACAAACYALPQHSKLTTRTQQKDVSGGRGDTPVWRHAQYQVPAMWPESWCATWWKPEGDRRNLVKAAALILAEIERLDRASHQPTPTGEKA